MHTYATQGYYIRRLGRRHSANASFTRIRGYGFSLALLLRGTSRYNSQIDEQGVRYVVYLMISGALLRPDRCKLVADDGIVSVYGTGPVINVSSVHLADLLAVGELKRQTIFYSRRQYAGATYSYDLSNIRE